MNYFRFRQGGPKEHSRSYVSEGHRSLNSNEPYSIAEWQRIQFMEALTREALKTLHS